jgi:hypothetical protein
MKYALPHTLALLIAILLTTGCRNEPTPLPAPNLTPGLLAGLRASPYGAGDLFAKADYWIRCSRDMAGRLPGAKPAVIWILGTMEASEGPQFSGRTVLNFPGENGKHANIVFSETDGNEEILKGFDQAGLSVWLQVEPGDADLPTLINLVLSRYRHHPCVIGFGVDVEWHRWSRDQPEGGAVGDAQATAWLAAVQGHKPDYRLFLKHWRSDMMPPTLRQGIMFLDDSQMFSSLQHMREEFSAWGRHFAPAEVGFQYGYGPDRLIWSAFPDPAADLARLFMDIPNAREFYWVDFTMRELWGEGE